MSHVTYADEIHALETILARVRKEKAALAYAAASVLDDYRQAIECHEHPDEAEESRLLANDLQAELDKHYAGVWTERRSADRFTSPGIAAVLAERRRQVEVEGYTPEHDDAHTGASWRPPRVSMPRRRGTSCRASTLTWPPSVGRQTGAWRIGSPVPTSSATW